MTTPWGSRSSAGGARTEHLFGSLLPPGTDRTRARRQLGRTLGSWRGRVQHRCARGSAQLVDKSVDDRLSTCGEDGGHGTVTPPTTPRHLRERRPRAVDDRKRERNFSGTHHVPHALRGAGSTPSAPPGASAPSPGEAG